MSSTRKNQKGAAAIEMAFVFPIFFMLLYGILMYGFIFLQRLGLQHAAEDGARAALLFQMASGTTAADRLSSQLNARVSNAAAVASTQASWMNGLGTPTVSVGICPVGTDPCVGADTSCTAAAAYTNRCQVVVTVGYGSYKSPLPALPGFGLLTPSTLYGKARVLFDARALMP